MSSVQSVKRIDWAEPQNPLNLQLKNVNLQEIRPPAPAKKGNDPWSELLDPDERKKAFNAGQSIDSKRVTEALGFLDMK